MEDDKAWRDAISSMIVNQDTALRRIGKHPIKVLLRQAQANEVLNSLYGISGDTKFYGLTIVVSNATEVGKAIWTLP